MVITPFPSIFMKDELPAATVNSCVKIPLALASVALPESGEIFTDHVIV